jgi:hypothetical protein
MREIKNDLPLYGKDFGDVDFRTIKSYRPLSSRDRVTKKDLRRLGDLVGASTDSEYHTTIYYTNGIVEHVHSIDGTGRDCAVYFYE